MSPISKYFQTWTIKLSTTKTMPAVFHFHNKEAKREPKVIFNKETLLFCSEHKSLGVTLDRMLAYRWHLQSLPKRLTLPFALLRRISGSGATLAFVQYTAVYSTPAHCRSVHTHHQRRLANCGWLRASYTSGQLSYPRGQPTCWTSSQ